MTSTMPLSMLLDPAYRALESREIAQHNATHEEQIDPNGWVDKWVFQVLLQPRCVKSSPQEDEALRNFERWERSQSTNNEKEM